MNQLHFPRLQSSPTKQKSDDLFQGATRIQWDTVRKALSMKPDNTTLNKSSYQPTGHLLSKAQASLLMIKLKKKDKIENSKMKETLKISLFWILPFPRADWGCTRKWKGLGPRVAAQVALEVKNLPANAGDIRDPGSIPGSGRSPGGGHGNPLQYCCLKNPMDRGPWWATVHRVGHDWSD